MNPSSDVQEGSTGVVWQAASCNSAVAPTTASDSETKSLGCVGAGYRPVMAYNNPTLRLEIYIYRQIGGCIYIVSGLNMSLMTLSPSPFKHDRMTPINEVQHGTPQHEGL